MYTSNLTLLTEALQCLLQSLCCSRDAGRDQASLPGRAFSPRGGPGAEASRGVSPLEPRPHWSAGCSALGPAGPLRNCRLRATVRIKRATDPPATAPTTGGPSPHPLGSQPLGPSPGLPATVVHCPRPPAPGWGAGRSRREVLLVGAPLLEAPSFLSLALASGFTAAGRLGARQPPPALYTPPSAVLASTLPFRPACLRGGGGLGQGQGSAIPGVTPWNADPPRPPHFLLHLRGCSPLAWALVEVTGRTPG